MSKVNVYLNFDGTTEEAFLFYQTIFGTEFRGDISRMGQVPAQDGMPELSDAEKNLVMHVALPLIGDFVLMGTDIVRSMGMTFSQGNNVYINLMPDTRVETKKLFDALSAGGKVEMELQDMFWGDYYGSCTDKFGTRWMFNCSEKQ